MLAYLARYTHRVAISNRRLLSIDARGVTFKVKDYPVYCASCDPSAVTSLRETSWVAMQRAAGPVISEHPLLQ